MLLLYLLKAIFNFCFFFYKYIPKPNLSCINHPYTPPPNLTNYGPTDAIGQSFSRELLEGPVENSGGIDLLSVTMNSSYV